MDTGEARSEILETLETSFGKSVAMLIVMSATTSADVPTHDLSEDEFQRLVDAVCGDERVTGMLGQSEAQSLARRWRTLV